MSVNVPAPLSRGLDRRHHGCPEPPELEGSDGGRCGAGRARHLVLQDPGVAPGGQHHPPRTHHRLDGGGLSNSFCIGAGWESLEESFMSLKSFCEILIVIVRPERRAGSWWLCPVPASLLHQPWLPV